MYNENNDSIDEPKDETSQEETSESTEPAKEPVQESAGSPAESVGNKVVTTTTAGARTKYGIVENQQITQEKLTELKNDNDFKVTEEGNDVTIKERLVE